MLQGAIGFRTKTAKAIAIALSSPGSPKFEARRYLELYDHKTPQTAQPHHEVMELPWPAAMTAVRKYVEMIDDVATEQLRTLLKELKPTVDVRRIAVVGSPDRNLEKIGNRHIRAHAAEGMLYRRSMERAAKRCGVECRAFGDRDFDDLATQTLGRTSKEIAKMMKTLGQSAGRPWRADERAAATAAWIVLTR